MPKSVKIPFNKMIKSQTIIMRIPDAFAGVSCGDVTPVDNGDKSVASYTCKEGYNLVGVSNRTCTATEEWSPALTIMTQCGK